MELPLQDPSFGKPALSSSTEGKEEKQRELEINEITRRILRGGFKVHTAFGPGLFEKTYHRCLFHELKKDGLRVESEVELPVVYDGVIIDPAYRVDLRVENKVLVEVKAVEAFADVHTAQMLTYLQLSGIRVGLLLNFNVVQLLDGIKRIMR